MFTSQNKLWKFHIHWIQHMKSLMFETKLLHSQNSHVGHSNSMHRSIQIRHVGLN